MNKNKLEASRNWFAQKCTDEKTTKMLEKLDEKQKFLSQCPQNQIPNWLHRAS